MRPSRTRSAIIAVPALLAVLAIYLFLFGRGESPDYPFAYADPAKSDPSALIGNAELLEDMDYLTALIEESHPNPYQFISRDDFLSGADRIKERILSVSADSVPRIDGYYFLQRLVALLQDEHTSFMFRDEWLTHWPERFPLELSIIDGRVYVEDVSGRVDIPKNVELIAINGNPVSVMLSELMPLVNETLLHYKYQIIEEDFDRLLQTYADMPPPWKVTYLHGGKEHYLEVPGVNRERQLPREQTRELYSESILEVDGIRVPVLEIPRFYYPDKAAYEAFIDGFFRKHADKDCLVIDLRKNPGGDGRWGFFVLDYRASGSFMIWRRFDFRISPVFVAATRYFQHKEYYNRGIPRVFWRFAASWVPDNYWWDKIHQAPVGEYVEDHNAVRTPDSDKVTFGGKVFLLISHRTNSAAVVFAAIFRNEDFGVIVGRETGGRIGFTSDPIFVEMPHSHMRLSLPVAILELPGDDLGRGVIPDIPVPPGIGCTDPDVDSDLEKVKELIRTWR